MSEHVHVWDYNERWDSYYCSDCRVWLEEKACDDSEACAFCNDRPDRPPLAPVSASVVR